MPHHEGKHNYEIVMCFINAPSPPPPFFFTRVIGGSPSFFTALRSMFHYGKRDLLLFGGCPLRKNKRKIDSAEP